MTDASTSHDEPAEAHPDGNQDPKARSTQLVQDLEDLQNRSIARSLNDAQVLLWYTSREGIEIEETILEQIVQARNNYNIGNWDQDKELQFWNAFRQLSAKARPISVDSVRSIMPTDGKRITGAGRMGRIYIWSTIGVLFLIVVFQVYWFVGNNILTEIENIRKEIVDLEKNRAGIESRRFALNQLIERNYEEIDSLSQQASNPEEAAKLEALRDEIQEKIQEQTVLISEVNAIYANEQQLDKALASNFVLLSRWDLTSRNVEIGELVAGQDDLFETIPMQGSWSPYFPRSYPGFRELSEMSDEERANYESEQAKRQAELVERLKKKFEREYLFEVSLKTSQSLLQTLNSYILPLFYGLLGALAYILRTIASEIRTITFSEASAVRYMLRWPLGMLAGITVGFFFKPEDLTGLAVLTPIAVAFIAGYSVELVFTALDKIVSAFTEGQARPAPGK